MDKFNSYEDQKKWFVDRIGKTIWRNRTTCTCGICEGVYKEGLLVHDEYHAIYLADLVGDYAAEGSVLEYFDTVEERDKFELSLINKSS